MRSCVYLKLMNQSSPLSLLHAHMGTRKHSSNSEKHTQYFEAIYRYLYVFIVFLTPKEFSTNRHKKCRIKVACVSEQCHRESHMHIFRSTGAFWDWLEQINGLINKRWTLYRSIYHLHISNSVLQSQEQSLLIFSFRASPAVQKTLGDESWNKERRQECVDNMRENEN